MSCCEKCWTDANRRAFSNRQPLAETYNELIIERLDTPCSPKEQAGQFWDEEKQCDSREVQL